MIKASLVLAGLRATSKKQVLEDLSVHAARLCAGDAGELFNTLFEREKIGSTGIGGGVAIPHIRVEGIDGVVGIFAQLAGGVDFEAIDDRPVDLIFILLAPAEGRSTGHLKALAQASKFLRDPDVCQRLRAGATVDELTCVLDSGMTNAALASAARA